jgi:spore coat polysaccharide biosynthesis protein SpsF
MNVLALTQARIGSSRLPGKILKTIEGESLLEIHLKRVLKSNRIDKLMVATTLEPGIEKVEAICSRLNVGVYKGSLTNVLERFYEAASTVKPKWVVRLTSDCPLIDHTLIDAVIDFAVSSDLDYASNTLNPTFPDGVDVEVFKFSALEKAMSEAKLESEKEHVTPFIWKNSTFNGVNTFKSDCFLFEADYSNIRLTVDTNEDFEVIKSLIELKGSNMPWISYVKALQDHPDLMKLNESHMRNEGYAKSLNNDKIIGHG